MTLSDCTFSFSAGKKLTNHAKNSIAKSILLARQIGENKIKNIHLLYSIFCESGSMGALIMKDAGLKRQNFSKLSEETRGKKKMAKKEKIPTAFSESAKNTLLRSFRIARELKSGYVGTEHIAYALFESDDSEIKNLTEKFKNKKAVKLPELFRAYQNNFDATDIADRILGFSDFGAMPNQDFPQEIGLPQKTDPLYEKNAAPYLAKFAANVNQIIFKNPDTIIGREQEIERMIYILGRKNKNNPLLIGHPGVGKTALVYGLAKMINERKVPAFLLDKKIMNLDVASIVAGTSFRGEFEARLKEVIKETANNKNIILFIDEIHNITGAGNISGSLDLANIIKPALSQGDIRLIGATTFPEFKKHIEKDAALERRFQPILVKEPGIIQAKQIISGIKGYYEKFHGVNINQEIADLSVELSSRYIKNRFLPDKAIDVIDETASYIRAKARPSEISLQIAELESQIKLMIIEKERLIKNENYEKAIAMRTLEKDLEEKTGLLKKSAETGEKDKITLHPEDIYKTIARMIGIPQEKLAKSKNEKIKNISRVLDTNIIGQKDAIKKISGVLLRSQSGLENENRPIGSFLFMGPTGVGKTLTAKVLAKEFFSDPEAFIRIDMSEFTERHTVSSLIGSPAGYIGYGEGGRLTEKVKRNPYCVVLFDEIEKAHPEVTNILLQILDEGFLTDAEGIPVNFRNAIIILTSNIGVDVFSRISGIGFSEKKESVSQKFDDRMKIAKENAVRELENFVRPELLNRLDNIIVFNSLRLKDIEEINKFEISQLQKKLVRQNIIFKIEKPAIMMLAKKSMAANDGARPIRRNIQEMLENKIAEMIVYDKVKSGKIKAAVKKGRIILK